jgi:hypothetical protein
LKVIDHRPVLIQGPRFAPQYAQRSELKASVNDALLCGICCMEEENASPPAVQRHSMTLSALASTVGEIFSSSALAVLKLITNSNLVGCSTGKSAGFAPFKILDT